MNLGSAIVTVGSLLAFGCGKSGSPDLTGGSDAPEDSGIVGGQGDAGMSDARPMDGQPGDGSMGMPLDGPIHTPGMPGIGAHSLNYYPLAAATAASITVSMATQPSGSVIVVGVGRGDKNKFVLPTDNKGNSPYRQIDVVHSYTRWDASGTALYAFPAASGGGDFKVSTTTGKIATGQYDEITMAAVEVVEGNEIKDFAWNEVKEPPLKSGSVTTTQPATLIAFWWGDGFPGDTGQSAVPNNGFTVIESNAYALHSYVQLVVAVKNVTIPDTYDVTWTAMPVQGAQMWLVAVQ